MVRALETASDGLSPGGNSKARRQSRATPVGPGRGIGVVPALAAPLDSFSVPLTTGPVHAAADLCVASNDMVPAKYSNRRIPIPILFALVLSAPLVSPCSPAFAQDPPSQPEEKPSEKVRRVSYGVEIGLSSGHTDRGLVISDRPVVQPVTWMSVASTTFSLWSNVTLVDTTDGARPQIVEMELTRAHEWRNLTIEPAVRIFFYRDPVSIDSSRSIEGWLYLTYDVGPFSLVTNHSFDVLTQKGAYFGDVGVLLDRRVSQRIEVGGSFKTGWASSRFNDAYVGVHKSAFNLITAESWLTAYVKPHFYVRSYFQFSNIVDHAVRAKLARPTLFLVGLATGVEF